MDIGTDDDIYIPRLQWTNRPNTLSIQRLDRLQQKLELLLADITTGKTQVILTDTDTCWVDVHDDLTFMKTTDQFLWSSERDGYRHLYLYDMKGKLLRQLTRGPWEVDRLVGVDEKLKFAYFTST